MSFLYNHNNLKNAKLLRKNMTDEERKLWYLYLKKHKLKWQRQKPIGNYIVDFYCPSIKLVIEIDGGQHFTSEAVLYDKERTIYLNNLGLEVIRFLNLDIRKDLDSVCRNIETKIFELGK